MGFYGILWDFMGFFGIFMGVYGMLWDFYGSLWDVMGFYGIHFLVGGLEHVLFNVSTYWE